MKTIWCLFSKSNDYNQPYHNLVAWWSKKPTHKQISKIIKCEKEDAKRICEFENIIIDNYNTFKLTEVTENSKLYYVP